MRRMLQKMKRFQCLAGGEMLACGIAAMYIMVMAGSVEPHMMFANYILIVAGVAAVHCFAKEEPAGMWPNRDILHKPVLFVAFVLQQAAIALCLGLVIYSTLSEQSMSKIGTTELFPAALAAAISVFHYSLRRRSEKKARLKETADR